MADRTTSRAPSPLLSYGKGEKIGQKRQRSSLLTGGIIIVAVVVLALALGLGLGLGLGLKHSGKATTPSEGTTGNTSSPHPPNSYASQDLTSLRLDTKDYDLDVTEWDIAAPPRLGLTTFRSVRSMVRLMVERATHDL